jgi:hypothetical protein
MMQSRTLIAGSGYEIANDVSQPRSQGLDPRSRKDVRS